MKNNQPKSKIFYLAFGYGIKTQIIKIKKKFFSTRKMAMISTFIFLAVGSAIFFSANYFAKGATYGWLQASWSGGADTGVVANHTDNRTLWTKFFSKDANVDTSSDQLTLSSGSSSVVQTTTTDFDAGAKSGFMIDPTSVANQVTADFKYFNASGICAGLRGVYYQDVSSTKQWKTSDTACASPQCSGGVLVADNTVDFSLYPARDACKALGGVLPTLAELQCMYTNRASFGNNFVASYYWSAREYDSTYAYLVNFSNGSTDGLSNKTSAYYVRCVRR